MEGQKFFNKKQLYFNFKLIEFYKNKFYGINIFFISKLEERLEVLDNYPITIYKVNKWLLLNNLLMNIVPKNQTTQKKLLSNLYMLDYVNSYRGYRHLMGLPTRGQRTWTNGNTIFYSNNLLRNFKVNLFKKKMALGLKSNINNAFYLEQLNFIWKNQWELEWNLAQRHHTISLKKNKGYVKYDVDVLSRINPNVKDFKKQKLFSIGFEPGFTQSLMKNNFKK